MRSSLRLLAPVLAASIACAPAGAAAQSKPPGPEDPYAEPPDPYEDMTKAIAAEAYLQGLELAKKKQWQEAYAKFFSAWTDYKHWQTASSLGRAELEIGKYRAAVRHLELALGEPKVPPRARAEIEELLAKAKAATGTIRIRAVCDLPAVVLVDGEKIGETPYSDSYLADPGEHEIEVQRDDRREKTTTVVHTSETVEVTLELHIPVPPPPPPPRRPPPPPPPPSIPKLPFAIGLSALTVGGVLVGGVLVTDADESHRMGGIAAFSTATALGVASGLLWGMMLSGTPAAPGASSPKAALVPLAGPGHAGLLLQGVF